MHTGDPEHRPERAGLPHSLRELFTNVRYHACDMAGLFNGFS